MTWQTKLLRWYRSHKRDLPWRRNPTPYRILVSEIMLQQTTVKTVIPYYRRFLKSFPSLRALARAKETDVLAAWSGLGYYARARNLQKTSQICVRQYKACLPRETDELKTLPGIGAYTAGAIASIAYDKPAPIVDGNVARVYSRLFRMKNDPKSPAGLKKYWERATNEMVKKSCGDFNQALMELGALICSPTRPLCHLCPIHKECLAFQQEDPTAYPQITKRIQYRNIKLSSALILRNGSLLMIQRPSHGVLSDMWEFPMIEGELEELLSAFSLKLPPGKQLKPIRHSIMNQRIQVRPWLFQLNNRGHTLKPRKSRWVSQDAIQQLPTSSMVQKLLTLL